MTDAASIFHIESPHAIRNLKKRLNDRLSEQRGFLECAQDWPDYKMRIGRIAGLCEAIAICEEMEKDER